MLMASGNNQTERVRVSAFSMYIYLNYNKIQIEIEYMLNDTQALNFLAQLNAFIAENQPSTVMITRQENDGSHGIIGVDLDNTVITTHYNRLL